MTPIDRTAAEAWLGALPGGSLAEQYVAQWDSFAGTSSPVVTLFGSYDTGKSALLRRFLVDAGETVPDWLTISARHETFEVRETTLHGCCVRDTPGFVVGASDMRGRMNTENAMSAVNLTDIAIATVTPQLATAERDALRAVVSESWLPGSLWFIISRFDEAGVDPDSDVNEYRELRRRKVQELRESFDLHSSTPIFVVAQDSFQLAGQERQPDPAIWDDSREWDGIDEVAGALSAIPGTDLSALRTAAERRYWRHAVASTVDELRRRLVDHERDLATARSGVDRRGAWLEDLQAIDAAARASLRGSVAEAVRIELDFVPGTLADSQGQASELSRVLERWFRSRESQLDRLRQDVRRSTDRQRTTQSWESFDALVREVRSAHVESEAPADDEPGVAAHVRTVGPMLIHLLKAYDKANGVNRQGNNADRFFGDKVAVAEAALPLALYFAEHVETYLRKRAAGEAEHHAIETCEAHERQAISELTDMALERWAPLVEGLRATIVDETSSEVDLYDGLETLVGELRRSIESGKGLLGSGATG